MPWKVIFYTWSAGNEENLSDAVHSNRDKSSVLLRNKLKRTKEHSTYWQVTQAKETLYEWKWIFGALRHVLE